VIRKKEASYKRVPENQPEINCLGGSRGPLGESSTLRTNQLYCDERDEFEKEAEKTLGWGIKMQLSFPVTRGEEGNLSPARPRD